jgi:hypothetical protein
MFFLKMLLVIDPPWGCPFGAAAVIANNYEREKSSTHICLMQFSWETH